VALVRVAAEMVEGKVFPVELVTTFVEFGEAM
jgi:hypothetical protein